MNTSFFLSTSIVCFAALSALACAAPAMAQGEQHVPASGYCTGETVQISGWETDLVRRNKGLEKFHWSAINTVKHYNVVATQVPQKPTTPAKALVPYHNSKPRVIGNWSADAQGHLIDKTCIATADGGARSAVSGNLRASNPSVYGQMRSYDNSHNNQQAQYGGERSTEDRVSGRIMHY